MTTISERYRRLAAGVTDKIAQVPPDRWSAPSPCSDWTALDVVRHLTETPAIFFGMIGEAAPDGAIRRRRSSRGMGGRS